MTFFSKIMVLLVGFHILVYFWAGSFLYFKYLNSKFINTFVVYILSFCKSSSCVIVDKLDTPSVKVFDIIIVIIIIATNVKHPY